MARFSTKTTKPNKYVALGVECGQSLPFIPTSIKWTSTKLATKKTCDNKIWPIYTSLWPRNGQWSQFQGSWSLRVLTICQQVCVYGKTTLKPLKIKS